MDKMRSLTNKIKSEIEARPEDGVAPLREEEMTSIITSIENNAELVKRYQAASRMGSENLSGDMPILKVHSTGKSNNELADGTEPNNGWFVYKPTKQQFQTIDCHILAISRGYNVPKLGGKQGETTYQNLLSGLMMVDGESLPFILYLNSKGHRDRMWEFGKKIHQYTHQKPFAIPMFALTVRLSTIQVPYEFTGNDGKTMKGKAWVVDYEVIKDGNGKPILVGDIKKFDYLEESAAKVIEKMEEIISSKSTNEKIIVDDDLKTAEEVFGTANEVGSDDIGF